MRLTSTHSVIRSGHIAHYWARFIICALPPGRREKLGEYRHPCRPRLTVHVGPVLSSTHVPAILLPWAQAERKYTNSTTGMIQHGFSVLLMCLSPSSHSQIREQNLQDIKTAGPQSQVLCGVVMDRSLVQVRAQSVFDISGWWLRPSAPK
jgi:hypothetical protein